MHVHTFLFLLLAAAAAGAITIDASQGLSHASLGASLRKMREDLATSPAIIADVERYAAAGYSLTADDLAREALLCARVVSGLSNVRLAESKISGAGAGVFATTDIAEGEIVTCYPGDVIMALPPGDGQPRSSYGENRITIWGTHVPDELREQATVDMEVYSLNVDENYALVGLRALRDDMTYVGHMCNDGARLNGLGGVDLRLTLPAYIEQTDARRNAGHETVEGCHTVTVATRDISRGEEIYVTYGATYWKGALRRRNNAFGLALANFL